MRRLIETDPLLEEKIRKVILKRKYKDFQHFAIVALENQALAEITDENPWITEGHQEVPSISHWSENQLIQINNKSNIMTLKAPDETEVVGQILWGQYYRFLPVKLATRVLANLSDQKLPKLYDFFDACTAEALKIRPMLVKIDKKERIEQGEKLSASFPTNEDKSMKRFANQYLMYVRSSDGKLDGMMPCLKFANMTVEDNNIRIGLTKFGLEFSRLQNPILDNTGTQALSQEEKEFLFNNIADNLPKEYEHMMTAISAISSGINSRDELNQTLSKFYSKHHNGDEWSEAVVNTMRSGLFSRMTELGVINREKKGRNVIYDLSDEGKRYLGGLRVA